MEQRSDELPEEAWREITVAEGSQGPRTYRFSAQWVRATKRRKPGEELWAVWRRNLDGSEPRYYLSNAPEDTTLETLAYVGGSRWRIETEFETEKGDVGLDEYETRSWAGWHHHIAMCLLGGAFLLGLQLMPRKGDRVVREMWGWTNTRPAPTRELGRLASPHSHVPAGRSVLMLGLQQDWAGAGEKDAPDHETAGVPGGA